MGAEKALKRYMERVHDVLTEAAGDSQLDALDAEDREIMQRLHRAAGAACGRAAPAAQPPPASRAA